MHEPTLYPPHFVLFCLTGQDEDAVLKAKGYVRKQGLTSEDVKIVRDEGCLLVVTKKDVRLKQTLQQIV